MAKTQAKVKTTASTLARIIHTLLASESFASVADLVDALKWRLATLHIRYTPDDVTTALRIVETARPLPRVEQHRQQRIAHREQALEDRIDRQEAAAIVRRLEKRLGVKVFSE